MVEQNVQSSGGIGLHRYILNGLFFFVILIPLLLSLIIKNGIGSGGTQDMIAYLQSAFQRSGFWANLSSDSTAYNIAIIEDGGKIFIQGVFCLIADITLVNIVVKRKNKILLPFVVLYSMLTLLIISAVCGDYVINWGYSFGYNRIMLWGCYVRSLHGLLPIITYSAVICSYVFYLVMDKRTHRCI